MPCTVHDFIECQGLPARVGVVPEMWHTGVVLVSAVPHIDSHPCFMMEILEVRGVKDKLCTSKYVPPISLKIPPYWWGICCLLEDCGHPGPSSQAVLTFGTLCTKQQVVEELNEAISYPLSYHYHSISYPLSTSKILGEILKNNDTICLITCCIVNWPFWQ